MITLIKGDITTAKVDAIVNAANPKMLGGGGVDGAIHKAAGPKLLQACRKVKSFNGIRCPFGEASLTEAGNLLSRFVIHAVGPIYHRTENPKQLLQSVYKQSLQLAKANGCQSIAFPAISCGAYGYPLYEAAVIAFSVCGQAEFKEMDICFYLYENEIYTLWLEILEEH